MIPARKLFGGLAFVLAIGGGALQFAAGPRGAAKSQPAAGTLAALDTTLAAPWVEMMRLSGGRLGRGGVVAVAARGDTVYVLQRNQWLFGTAAGISPSYGSAVRGAPDEIAYGVSIAAVPGGVAILDQRRQEISWWSLAGERLETRLVRPAAGTAYPEAIAADRQGAVLLAIRTLPDAGGGEWQVLRYARGTMSPDTLYRTAVDTEPSGVHNVPQIVSTDDGGFEIAPALEWRFLRFTADGGQLTTATRADGPRYRIPDDARLGYARVMERVSPAQARGMSLPHTWPPVRAVSGLTGGARLVLVAAAGADELHAEVIAADGTPLGRLWTHPESHRLFVADGSVYRVTDELDHSSIERQRILLP